MPSITVVCDEQCWRARFLGGEAGGNQCEGGVMTVKALWALGCMRQGTQRMETFRQVIKRV